MFRTANSCERFGLPEKRVVYPVAKQRSSKDIDITHYRFVVFRIYLCFQLIFPDVSTPLQVLFSRGDTHRVMNILSMLLCNVLKMTMESKCRNEKLIENTNKSKNEQSNVTTHENFNQFMFMFRTYGRRG